MDDLVQWLRAQLDDERAAFAAKGACGRLVWLLEIAAIIVAFVVVAAVVLLLAAGWIVP